MKKYYILFLLIFSSPIFADSLKSEKKTLSFSNEMISLLFKEKFQEAFNSAKPYWPIPPVEIDSIVNKINQQWPLVNQRFGKAIGTEFIRKETIGKSFVRYYYLHKFQNHAIYWRIGFYKPSKEWKINSVVFLDSLDILYEKDC